MKTYDWIVIRMEPMAIVCNRCDTVQPIALPISVDCLAGISKAFTETHKHCKSNSRKAGGEQ